MTRSDPANATESEASQERDGTRGEQEAATFRTRDEESLTEAIVRAVSAETGTDQLELPPLYSVVDPDALAGLIAVTGENTRQTDCTVAFDYNGRNVRVRSDGTIDVGTSR